MENKILQEIIDYKIHTRFQRASANIRYTIKRRSSNFELMDLWTINYIRVYLLCYLDSRTNRNILQKWSGTLGLTSVWR